MSGVLRLLRRGALSAARNMAEDEALLDAPVGTPLTLRLYGWQPFALSLGYFQNPSPELIQRCADEGVDLVRRLTGGGSILHAHELTYALVGDEGEAPFAGDVASSYRLVHDLIREIMSEQKLDLRYASELGAPEALRRNEQPFLCFDRSSALDLVLSNGTKMVGSAKRRRGGRALQHGSIIVDRHPLGGETPALGTEGELLLSELENSLPRALSRQLRCDVDENEALAPDQAVRADVLETEHRRGLRSRSR